MNHLIKSNITRIFLPVFALLLILSCQKEFSNQDGGGNIGTIPDLVTKVTSSISGFVTDENNTAVMGASVTAGTGFATTDKYGYFEIKNVLVVKDAAVVTVTKPGYFKGIKTYLATENKAAFFRIKLIPKTLAGTIDGGTGGNITLSNGLIIALPANGVVNASTNAAYTGSVNVAAHWIDPTGTYLSQEMPGDLRGINSNGSIKLLTTYGMAAVELTSTSGELLQIATGKKATLTMPLPAALVAAAPASIPLWSFDEAKGLWKEEGQATKTGNTYVGEVSHFSFWNCDVPNNYVQFNCTVKNADGLPISNALVKISVVGSPYNAGFGITDSSGYTSGAIPNDAQLLLEIFNGYNCGAAIYSQNFSTTNVNVSLGIITVNTTLGAATITGTATDCTNNPVTNGYIITRIDNMNYRHNISNTGSFNFTILLCNNTANATFTAEDLVSMQQGTSLNQTIIPGANAIGNLQACGLSIEQFITYTINGGPAIEFVYPTDSVGHYGNGTNAVNTIYGSGITNPSDFINFSFTNTGIGAGSTQLLQNFGSSSIGSQTTTSGSVNVNITEYGAVGEFIAGNFSGIIISSGTPPVDNNVVCSFRVRRSF